MRKNSNCLRMKMNPTESKLKIENTLEFEAAWILSTLKSGSSCQLPQPYENLKAKEDANRHTINHGRRKRQSKKNLNGELKKSVEKSEPLSYEHVKQSTSDKRQRKKSKNDLDSAPDKKQKEELENELASTSEKKTRKRRKIEPDSNSDTPQIMRKRRGKKNVSVQETVKDEVKDSQAGNHSVTDTAQHVVNIDETENTAQYVVKMEESNKKQEPLISRHGSMQLPHIPVSSIPNSSSHYLFGPSSPMWSVPPFHAPYFPKSIFEPRPTMYPIPLSLYPIPGARLTANVPLARFESQQAMDQSRSLLLPKSENVAFKSNSQIPLSLNIDKHPEINDRQNSALNLTQAHTIAQRNMVALSGGSMQESLVNNAEKSDIEGQNGGQPPSCHRDSKTPELSHLMSQLPLKKRRKDGSMLGSGNSTPCASPQPIATASINPRNGPIRESDTSNSNATSPSSVCNVEDRKRSPMLVEEAPSCNNTKLAIELAEKSHQSEEVTQGTPNLPTSNDNLGPSFRKNQVTKGRDSKRNGPTTSLKDLNIDPSNDNVDISDNDEGTDSDSTVDFEKDLTWKGHLISVTARKNAIYVTQAKNGIANRKQNIAHEKPGSGSIGAKNRTPNNFNRLEENKLNPSNGNIIKQSDMLHNPENNNNSDKLVIDEQRTSQENIMKIANDNDSKSPQISSPNTGQSQQEQMRIDPRSSLRLLYECKQAVTPDEDGDLPLHIAVAQENENAVKQLLKLMHELGVSVDKYNKMRQTSFHLAVITQQATISKLLLEAGADPNQPDRHGNTGLHLSVIHGSNECLELLLSLREPLVNLSLKNYDGLTSLHIGVEKGNLHAVEALLNMGMNTNIQDGKSGRSALFFAAEKNQIEIVTLLIKNGASVNLPNYSGASPIQVANSRGFTDISKVLLQGGASPLSRKDENSSLYARITKNLSD